MEKVTSGKTHIPKGLMCLACKDKLSNCSKLPFNTMPKLKDFGDGYVEVRCLNFRREND